MIKSGILIQKRGAVSEQINTSSGAIYFYCASIVCVEVKHVSAPGLCARPGWWGRESDTIHLDVLSMEEKRSRCAISTLHTVSGNRWERLRCIEKHCMAIDSSAHMFACVWVGLHYQQSHQVAGLITTSKIGMMEKVDFDRTSQLGDLSFFCWCQYVYFRDHVDTNLLH